MTGLIQRIEAAKEPSLDERNEGYAPPLFNPAGGTLGVTPILWKFRMAYKWEAHFEESNPDWDQCCTCHVFAVTEREARERVWQTFGAPSVVPERIASCHPVRFRNANDDAIDERLAAILRAERKDDE